MKTKVLFTLTMSAILSLISIAQEKDRKIGFELSGGPSLVTRELVSGKLEKGIGLEGIFHYRFMPHTGVYAGWEWNRFNSEKSFAGDNLDFEEFLIHKVS